MTDVRRHISQGSAFETRVGYSRAVVQGPWVFVSGTTGFDYSTMSIPEDVVAQADQAIANIDSALREAGATAADVVRVSYFLPDVNDFDACIPSVSRYFGEAKPAATLLGANLVEPRIKIEIEVTALKRDGA